MMISKQNKCTFPDDEYFIVLSTVPINTIIMRVVGVRVMAALGSLLVIVGMILSAYATQIWQLILTYSVLTCEFF